MVCTFGVGVNAVPCVAEAESGSTLCAVHASYWRRRLGDVAIGCASCGKPIRIGALWVVRAEGAFHARARCLALPSPVETSAADVVGSASA
jgi:hypothetical protein